MTLEKKPFDLEAGKKHPQRYISHWNLKKRLTRSVKPAASQSQEYIDLLSKFEGDTQLVECLVENITKQHICYLQAELRPRLQRFESLLSTEAKKNKPIWSLQVVGLLYDFLTTSTNTSVSAAVDWLLEKDVIKISTEDDQGLHRLATELVFTLFGIMSMLYSPLPCDEQEDNFLINPISSDGDHTFSAYGFDSIDAREVNRPFSAMLLDLGELLPRSYDEMKSSPVPSTQLNAAVFTKIGRIRIAWTDLLPAHLDFDPTSRTLYIFQRPTFCLLNIPSESVGVEQSHRVLLESCLDFAGVSGTSQGISSEADYMKEILLSIHLLFATTPKSRSLFHTKKISSARSKEAPDPLLKCLCTQPWPFTQWSYKPKKAYILNQDFPILGRKLEVVNAYLQMKQPSSFWLLWRDRRNPMQWWTFWAVFIIGGLGLIFAMVQTGLSAAQVYYARVGLNQT